MGNQGVAPVDFATPVGQVRTLMGDTDPTEVENGRGTYTWFSDDEIGVYLSLNGGDPRRAAVAALRLVAFTPALKLRKWQSADLAVDGPAITKALGDLISGIEAGIAAADAAQGYFSIDTETLPTPWWDYMPESVAAGEPFLIPGFPRGLGI